MTLIVASIVGMPVLIVALRVLVPDLNVWRHFVEIALPMARPAIAGGLALALMETVADFGTVKYFGINTFATGIYRTWFALGEPIAAAQLAAMLMIFVLVILWLECRNRGQARYDHTTTMRPLQCYALTGVNKSMATAICWPPIILLVRAISSSRPRER